MRCKNCGSMNADGAKFCESCGAALESVNKQQSQSNTESKVSNPTGSPGSPKKLPKNIIFGAVGAVAVLFIIVIVAFAMNSSKVIDLNKYISFESSGYDGYGKASISVDWDKLEKDYGKKVKYSSKGKKEYGVLTYAFEPMSVLRDAVSEISLDKSEKLSNGDKVKYTWKVSDDTTKSINYKLKYKDGEFEIKNLNELSKFDPFENVKLSFSGIAPNGKAEIAYSGNDTLNKNNFKLDKFDKLKNNDTVTVSLNLDEDQIASMADRYGRIPEKMSQTYTVSGLETYVTQYSELPQDFIKEVNDKAKEVVKEYTDSAYGEGTTLSDLKYEGYVLKTDLDEVYNGLYIVYSRVLTSTDSKYVTTKMYYPVAFRTLMLTDKVTYKSGPEIIGKSSYVTGDSKESKGYKRPHDFLERYRSESVTAGDGFEKFEHESYVHKLEDMTDEYRKSLQDQARLTLDAYIAKDYKPNMQVSDIQFVGEYLLYTSDDQEQFNGTNIYYVVFSANLSDANGKFPTTTIYYPVEYSYVMKLSDEDFLTANRSDVALNFLSLPNTWDTTRGYTDGNEMYKNLISSRDKIYEHQVSDGLKQFGE
ncbi:zinc ribbon domain-containing protein [Lachnoanaerobaculum orale]|uniref:Zinc ribbon domain-containing protein n=1 Tax=Lachnoanaerobaculum orale TaxID=979627 RepID=A0A3P3Q4L1_9FIRM|nr:zinc ribbon domain-containing protein [Lachnoanaerobaculum orale]RRJ16161.1 zinc ribbon domain-containing protein [Lachnoanaerobaculum orale]